MEAIVNTRPAEGMTAVERRVILAASLGTVFEWYDFFLVGALASEISRHFFSGVNPTAGFIFTLLSFAAGFFVRPLGAIVFGRLGDRAGRKAGLLLSILLMMIGTSLMALTPGYATIGIAAPILITLARRGDRLGIRFSDRGPGLPEDRGPEQLVPPRRGVGPRAEIHGLGLWIVRRAVHRLHGRLRIHSRAGAGVTFDIELPGLER